jgi:hypothetical protein
VISIIGLGFLAEILCKAALKLAAYCMTVVTIIFWFASDISWFTIILGSGPSNIQNALIGLVSLIYIILGSIIGVFVTKLGSGYYIVAMAFSTLAWWGYLIYLLVIGLASDFNPTHLC